MGFNGGSMAFNGIYDDIPSGKRLRSYRKSPLLMGKSTFSMVHGFNRYVRLPEGNMSRNMSGSPLLP
jgi:hypothetical protein